jgi:alanine-glyoxylate transaminase/serine-glyoxylate transaminase/serine-pyruvate transaminase
LIHSDFQNIAGSGTLTWDMTAANLLEKGDNCLVVNSGIFGDWFAECLEVYGGCVDQLRAEFGDCPSLNAIEEALKLKKYKLITVTHVDTSSGVLSDIKNIAEVVRKVSPDTMIALDGVCSVAAEEIRMEEWGLDVVMTASQKAIGVPPGLALMVVSQRALKKALNRSDPASTYFGSFKKWLPIMQKYEARQPSYFATPVRVFMTDKC